MSPTTPSRPLRRRARGVSLVETTFVVLLVVPGLLLLLHGITLMAVQWSDTSTSVVTAIERAERVRALVAEAVAQGAPIPALSVMPTGELREEEAPDAVSTWGSAGSGLVIRTADGYRILEAEGDRLVLRRVDPAGHVRTDAAVAGVAEAAFALAPRRGDPAGVAYQVRFRGGGPDAQGFAALRVDPRVAPPPLPTPSRAPRWGAGGDR